MGRSTRGHSAQRQKDPGINNALLLAIEHPSVTPVKTGVHPHPFAWIPFSNGMTDTVRHLDAFADMTIFPSPKKARDFLPFSERDINKKTEHRNAPDR